MRMWMTDPRIMCRQHLLGEHVELHMTVGALNLGTSIKGYLASDLLEPQNLKSRHTELVTEMASRGYHHKSPLPELAADPPSHNLDRDAAKAELLRRCPECRERSKAVTHG